MNWMNIIRKFFLGCFFIWLIIAFIIIINEFYSEGATVVILIPFLFGPAFVLYIFYYLVKHAPEKSRIFWNTLFCEKYVELKEKYGPILEETQIYLFIGRTRFPFQLSICKDAFFVSDKENHSFLVPYSQYTIRKETHLGRSYLIIKNILPKEATQYAFNRNLTLEGSSLHPKCFDVIMSFVQQVQGQIALSKE